MKRPGPICAPGWISMPVRKRESLAHQPRGQAQVAHVEARARPGASTARGGPGSRAGPRPVDRAAGSRSRATSTSRRNDRAACRMDASRERRGMRASIGAPRQEAPSAETAEAQADVPRAAHPGADHLLAGEAVRRRHQHPPGGRPRDHRLGDAWRSPGTEQRLEEARRHLEGHRGARRRPGGLPRVASPSPGRPASRGRPRPRGRCAWRACGRTGPEALRRPARPAPRPALGRGGRRRRPARRRCSPPRASSPTRAWP